MNRIIKNIVLLSFLSGVFAFQSQDTFAQPDEFDFGPRREKIEAMKTAFIARKTYLTRTEASSFWPIYNEYQDASIRLRSNRDINLDDFRKLEGLSDAEAERLLSSVIKMSEDVLQLRLKFIKDIRAFLPARKVLLYLQAERQFNRELLKRARE